MKSSTTNGILLTVLLLVLIAGAVAYPTLPDQIAAHWNAAGQADGFVGKFWGVFLLPAIMAGIFLIYFFIPKLDPLKENIESFRPAYNTFWVWLFAFFVYIFGLTLAWNLGYRVNFTVAIIPAFAILFYAIGRVLEKSKRNWFIGIRTPWTLSSDLVWEKTHRFGGTLFKIAAVVSLAGLFLRDSYAIAAIVVPVAVVAAATVVYSYLEYRKLK